MNIREQRKKDRIDGLKRMMSKKEFDTEELAASMIVNHGITKKTALEEINAVRKFLEK